MQYKDFSIIAIPRITDAFCKECKTKLVPVSDGLLSEVLFCPECESAYKLKLVKVQEKYINEEWLIQARKEFADKK